ACALSFVVGFSRTIPRRQLWTKAASLPLRQQRRSEGLARACVGLSCLARDCPRQPRKLKVAGRPPRHSRNLTVQFGPHQGRRLRLHCGRYLPPPRAEKYAVRLRRLNPSGGCTGNRTYAGFFQRPKQTLRSSLSPAAARSSAERLCGISTARDPTAGRKSLPAPTPTEMSRS